MTEAEWWWNDKQFHMLDHLRGRATGRKLRLFALACCQRTRPTPGSLTGRAIGLLERAAEGAVAHDEVAALRREVRAGGDDVWDILAVADAAADTHYYLSGVADWCIRHAGVERDGRRRKHARKGEQRHQTRLLRDVFGPLPFRAVAVDPAWLTSDVLALAAGIYADRAFDRMPILADALEDAGCNNDDILNHCRFGDAHVRGCWVVDLVLGKG
jgi:hypothetical protein